MNAQASSQRVAVGSIAALASTMQLPQIPQISKRNIQRTSGRSSVQETCRTFAVIGIIEKVIVECILEVGDEELRQDIFFAAGIPSDRVYRMDQHYPDTETARLIDAVLSVAGLSEAELFKLFSRLFFDVVEDVFPEFIRMSQSSEDLVRKQAKIHALIAAGSREPGESQKSTDKFQLKDNGPHHITVRYKSELQLSGLYEYLVHEAAKRFGDEVLLERSNQSVDEGGATLMSVKWTSIGGQPTEFFDETPISAKKSANG